MKKILSLVLALVLCLALCSCGKSKYVGRYECEGVVKNRETVTIDYIREMVLNKDGTGTIIMKSLTEKTRYLYGEYELKEGFVLSSYEITWKEFDGYLVVTGSGKKYFEGSEWKLTDLILDGTPVEISETYELKGNKLFKVGTTDYAEYTKVN